MVHHMHLNAGPYSMIASKKKTIELRLRDEKRKNIKKGDTIVFTNTETKEQLSVMVKKCHVFDTFATLYQHLPMLQCGYREGDKIDSRDMDAYYTKEQQSVNGVMGIEIELVEKSKNI